MKTTLIMRNTANPQRITLAHLQDADELTFEPAGVPAYEWSTGDLTLEAASLDGLPPQTANPQRTMLEDAPVG